MRITRTVLRTIRKAATHKFHLKPQILYLLIGKFFFSTYSKRRGLTTIPYQDSYVVALG